MIISSQMLIEKFEGIHGLARDLRTDLVSGISNDPNELALRRTQFGSNAFAPPKIKGIGELIMENFDDPINIILLLAAFVSALIGLIQDGFPKGLIEGVSITIALMIIIVVNSTNNWISERRLADLINLAEKQEVAVFRGSDT